MGHHLHGHFFLRRHVRLEDDYRRRNSRLDVHLSARRRYHHPDFPQQPV